MKKGISSKESKNMERKVGEENQKTKQVLIINTKKEGNKKIKKTRVTRRYESQRKKERRALRKHVSVRK